MKPATEPLNYTLKAIGPEQTAQIIGAEDAPNAILCFHGGYGLNGSPDMMHPMVGHLVEKDRFRVALASYKTRVADASANLDDMRKDALAAIDWARTAFPNGFWVMGVDLGGFLTLDAVMTSAEKVKGVLLVNPITDISDAGFSNAVIVPNEHAGLSPIARTEEMDTLRKLRCLILHAEKDDIIPTETSKRFADVWPGKHCNYLALPGTKKGFYKKTGKSLGAARLITRFILEKTSAMTEVTNRNQTVQAALPLWRMNRGFGGFGLLKRLGLQKQQKPKLPDDVRLLCCVGGQKAGTSWLYDQMSQSPQIHTGTVKERHYFDALWLQVGNVFLDRKVERLRDLIDGLPETIRTAAPNTKHQLALLNNLVESIAPFCSATETHAAYIETLIHGRGTKSVVCDFTPSYSGLNTKQIKEIDALGDVRFVFILRDPVDRLWSQIRMSYIDRGGASLAEYCEQRAIHLCNVGVTKRNFRADYLSTLAALDKGARNVSVVFYETLFEQETFDQLTDFIGVDSIEIDRDQHVNKGKSLPLNPEIELRLIKALAAQYEGIFKRFGNNVPAAWRERYNQISK